MRLDETVVRVAYPIEWESEYRNTRTVALWRLEFPRLFKSGALSTRPRTLDLFAQYALQYLLCKREGVESITWYNLGSNPLKSTNRQRTEEHWAKMREVMGADFRKLQDAIRAAGLKGFRGEPDLFCWSPTDGRWFFAEAKRKDRVHASQIEWFRVCREALSQRADLRIYELAPELRK